MISQNVQNENEQKLSNTSKQQIKYCKCFCIFAAEPPDPLTFGLFPQTHGVHMNYDQIMMSSTHGGGPKSTQPTPPSSAQACDVHI